MLRADASWLPPSLRAVTRMLPFIESPLCPTTANAITSSLLDITGAQSREHRLVILVLLAAFVAVYLLLIEEYQETNMHQNLIMRYYTLAKILYRFDKEKLPQNLHKSNN